MYGLPLDTDLSFFIGAPLLQVCIGENEVIANLHPDISVMIASILRVTTDAGVAEAFDDARSAGIAVLPLLGHEIKDATAVPEGTLRLIWDDGTIVEIIDDSKEYESYTIRHGEDLIVV